MFRRSTFRLVYEQFEGHVSGDKGHMTLQQACSIFGFQMDEEWNKKEIKSRYKKLALKYHPDNGGTNEQFQLLKEAQTIMLTHRHDKGVDRTKAKGEVNFRRMSYDDLTNTIHRQTADRPEYRSFSLQDFAVFIAFLTAFVSFYLYRAWKTQRDVLRSRWSLTADQISSDYGGRTVDSKQWHPWRADGATQDRMDEIGLIQGSVRRELVEEKRAKAPLVYTPWQSGGPFARGMAPHHGPAVSADPRPENSPSTPSGVATNSP